jgi:hypothetical protein
MKSKSINIEKMEQEDSIIKYALNFLISNLEDDVLEDLGEIMETNDPNEVEYILNELIENY